MKAIAVVMAAGLAGTAVADIAPFDVASIDRSSMTIYSGAAVQATPIGAESGALFTAGTAYENMDPGNGFLAFPPATGVLGTADYDSAADDDINMGAFRFVGGVAAAGEVIFFDFFDAGGVFYDGFGVQFPQGGNFIWTITLATPQITQDAGFVQLFADDGSAVVASTGQWFLSDAAPTIGSAGAADATGPAGESLNHKFAIDAVPAPGSIALLGLGGLAAARRRR